MRTSSRRERPTRHEFQCPQCGARMTLDPAPHITTTDVVCPGSRCGRTLKVTLFRHPGDEHTTDQVVTVVPLPEEHK